MSANGAGAYSGRIAALLAKWRDCAAAGAPSHVERRDLIHAARLRKAEKAILHAIESFLGSNVTAWPGQELVAWATGYSRGQVVRVVGRLAGRGIIDRKVRAKTNGRGRAYSINWQTVAAIGEVPPAHLANSPSSASAHDQVAPAHLGQVAPAHTKRSLVKRPSEKATKARASHRKDDPETQERFERFWSSYPARKGRKVGKSDALAAFVRLSASEQDQAILAAGHYAKHCAASDEYAKDAVRFFRIGRSQSEPWREWLDPPTNGQPARSLTDDVAATKAYLQRLREATT